jgi:hypothetical protein
VIDEAGEGDLRKCFTFEDVISEHAHSEEVFTLPSTGAAALRVRGRIPSRVPGGAEQAHQLSIFLRDEVYERRANTEWTDAGGRADLSYATEVSWLSMSNNTSNFVMMLHEAFTTFTISNISAILPSGYTNEPVVYPSCYS